VPRKIVGIWQATGMIVLLALLSTYP